MIGVIPAAGKGTRLKEVGIGVPKSLVKINNRTLLERAISNLKEIGVKEIFVIVGYKKEEVISFLNSREWGVKIEIFIQEPQKGLADALMKVKDSIKDPFILHLPDTLFLDNYSFILDKFAKEDPDFLVLHSGELAKDTISSWNLSEEKIIGVNFGKDVPKGYRGIGLYVIKPIFFDYCEIAQKNLLIDQEIRETHVVLEMIKDARIALAVRSEVPSLEVTSPEDIMKAEEFCNSGNNSKLI